MPYDDTLPTDLDYARFLLGDTSNDAATELLSDAHIEAVLSRFTVNLAVGFMATGLAARFAQQPGSVSLPSGLSVSWAERVKYWKDLAAQMRAGGVTSAGAFSVAMRRADGYSDAAA